MSRKSVTPRPATSKAPTPAVPADLEDLLHQVEDRCSQAAGIVSAAARLVAGDELGLRHDGVPSVCAVALDHVAGELEALGDRALKAWTGAA